MQTIQPPPGVPFPAPGAAADSPLEGVPPQIPQSPQAAPSYGRRPNPRPTWRWAIAVVAAVVVLAVLGVNLVMWVRVEHRLDDQSRQLAQITGQAQVASPVLVLPPATVSEQPPADAVDARAKITAAYLAAFNLDTPDDQRVGLFGGDEALRSQFDRLRASKCAPGAQPLVHGILFTNPDAAVVKFAFRGPVMKAMGFDPGVEILGTATRSGDTWVVAPDALENAIALAARVCG